MNSFKKLFSILLLSFVFAFSSYSAEPVGYINVDYIIKNSDIGKKTLEKINNQNTKNINDLKKKDKILKDLETEIANKRNIISKEAFEKEVSLFREKVNIFKKEQKQIVNNFNNYKKNELNSVLKKISPIIDAYMEKKSIKILLDAQNIFMARNDLNFTDDILKEINNSIK
jgi:outer membrane protein